MTTELALSKESTNELTVLRDQLTIAEQRNEIMELKLALQTKQVQKASKLEDSLFSPALYDHYHGVAQMLSRTSAIPSAYKGKPGDIFVAMAMGYQLGFSIELSLQDIAVINGKPCLYGDGLISLVLSHPECEGVDEQPILDTNNAIIGYSCTVKRKGHSPHTKQFTMEEAIAAGLAKKDVWKSYPTRMLQMRARSLALRDKFADAMRGLRIAEVEKEDLRIIEGELVKEKPQAQKLKLVHSYEEEISMPMPIQHEQMDMVNAMMQEMNFDEERTKKVMGYYSVNGIEHLSASQANNLITQLQKLQTKETANAV